MSTTEPEHPAEGTAEDVDQDAGPASKPTGAAAEQPAEGDDTDSGPATEPQ